MSARVCSSGISGVQPVAAWRASAEPRISMHLVGADLGRVDLVVDGHAGDLAERGDELAGGAGDAGADVEDARLAALGEQAVGADDVAHVGEVAAGVG